MASTTGGTLKTSKHQNKHQTMLKKQQQQQANNQYQVPFVGHCSPMAYAPPPPLFHQPPYLAAGSQHQQQQLFSGAHTISRSKDLHKQYGQQATTHGNMKNQALVYYDQPYLGFGAAATGGPPVPQPAPPMLPNGPYAAMSLAVRSPKERGSIPASLVNGMATIGPGSSRHYLAAPIDLYKPYNHHQHNLKTSKLIYQDPLSLLDQHARLNKPLCRCRVMYLGSSVPHITKNGLHGIQEPLRHLYPEEKFSTNSLRKRQQQQHPNQSVTIDISHLSSSLGIDSWLSVWSNGLLLENVDEFGREIKRFFSIESLHYCAAVRFFDTTTLMTEKQLNDSENQPPQSSSSGDDPNNNNNNNDQMQDSMISANGDQSKRGVVRFLPLDAPIFQYPGMLDANHPPVFASIMRRTTGIKVLECHAFICRRDAASNALVRCCTHAYADFLSAKRMSAEFGEAAASANLNSSAHYNGDELHHQQQRHSRAASSMGRQHRHRADLTDGQFLNQAGALVQPRLDGNNNNNSKSISKNNDNNNVVDPSSLTLSRRQDQVRTRRPARSLSTGGTNSQEMTHSDENSLEVDSEDNYAIIMRQTTNDWSSNQQQQQANSRLQPASTGSKQANSQTPRVVDSSTNRRRSKTSRERRSKGSSKSLFKGFMPHEQQLLLDNSNKPRRAASGGHDELNRLSHSLDHLQVAYGLEAPACCRLGPASKCANISNSHSHSNTDDSDIKYSIVAGKQKRHSKSMQQLVQVSPTGSHQYQPHLMTMANEAEMVNRDFQAPRANSLTWTAGRQRRKAASCQDILAGQHRHHHHHSAGGSLSRGSSCSGRRRNRTHKGRSDSHRSSMSSLHQNSLAGSQMRLDKGAGGRHHHHHHQRARQLSQQHDASNYIYASCEDHPAIEPLEAQSLRVLRADCCVQPPQGGRAAAATTAKQLSDSHVSSSSSSSVKPKKSSKRRSSDQKQRLDQDQQQLQPPPTTTSSVGDPLGYYQFLQPPPPPPPLPLSRADCCSPNGLLMGPNSHQAAMYGLPPHLQGAYYLNQRHSQAGSQLYESPAYLIQAPGPGPMYLNAAAQLAHGPRVVSSDQYHPMFHHHPGSATMSHRHLAGPLYNGAPGSMMAMNGSSMTMAANHKTQSRGHKSSDSKRDSKLSKKSHTLATRFRCLSPPLNFLSNDRSSAASRSGQQPAQSHDALIDRHPSIDRMESPDQNNNNSYSQNKCTDNRQSSASASSAATSASERISPSDIVSGQPGFLATVSNGHHLQQEPAKQATSVQKRGARPKLSWIKRLSLTLSGGSSSSSHIRHHPDGSKQSSANLLNHSSELGSPQAETDGDHDHSEVQSGGATSGSAEERQASGQSEGQVAQSEERHDEEGDRPHSEPEQEQPDDVVSTKPKEQEQLKTKTTRKKGGLFSGTLTLGRKSRGNKTK